MVAGTIDLPPRLEDAREPREAIMRHISVRSALVLPLVLPLVAAACSDRRAGPTGPDPPPPSASLHGSGGGYVAIDLGTLGGTVGIAVAINEAGQVIGESHTASAGRRPTLWRPLTPVERLEAITADVRTLEADGVLNTGQARSLINKVNVATAMLNDGKTTPAVNHSGCWTRPTARTRVRT